MAQPHFSAAQLMASFESLTSEISQPYPFYSSCWSLNIHSLMQYTLRKPVTTSAVPHADISYSESTKILAVAANHLEGISVFRRGQAKQLCDDVVKRLSYCIDISPSSNTLISGSVDYTLEMLSFALASCVCNKTMNIHRSLFE